MKKLLLSTTKALSALACCSKGDALNALGRRAEAEASNTRAKELGYKA